MGVVLSLVQLVAGVIVLSAPCPGHSVYVSCYQPQTHTIYLSPYRSPGVSRRRILLHEYGHAYDVEVLRDTDRARFKAILGFAADTPWWADDDSPAESFADAYAACGLGVSAALWPVTPRQVRQVCRLLPQSAYGVWRSLPRRDA